MAWLRFDGRPQPVKEYGDALMADEFSELSLEKAVATTQTPRAESISLADARRRGDYGSCVECSVKVRLHPIGEGVLRGLSPGHFCVDAPRQRRTESGPYQCLAGTVPGISVKI